MLDDMIKQMKILKNSVKCNLCGDIIVSEGVDHKVSCKCGNIRISGGNQYLIREGINYEELTQYMLNE
jgi:hypothetical protein